MAPFLERGLPTVGPQAYFKDRERQPTAPGMGTRKPLSCIMGLPQAGQKSTIPTF